MIPFRKISNAKVKKLINFKLDYNIESGLKETIKWYRKNN